MASFYQRYTNGETETVYNDIYALGEAAFSPEHLPDVEKVLMETFKRVAYNLKIIHRELKSIDYQFKTKFKYNFERPLHKPLWFTDRLLRKLDAAVKPAGYIPLSLKYFYKIVGGVNFAWDYETNENIRWELADPIQIASLDAAIEIVTAQDWEEDMRLNMEDYESNGLDLSADDYHKDNFSGGPPYILQLTKTPCVDGRLFNEPNNTTFINYLRICFEHCGFPGIKKPELYDGCQAFFNKVQSQLQKI